MPWFETHFFIKIEWNTNNMLDDLKKAALEYHRFPTPGKLEITPSKPLNTQRIYRLPILPCCCGLRRNCR